MHPCILHLWMYCIYYSINLHTILTKNILQNNLIQFEEFYILKYFYHLPYVLFVIESFLVAKNPSNILWSKLTLDHYYALKCSKLLHLSSLNSHSSIATHQTRHTNTPSIFLSKRTSFFCWFSDNENSS